MKHTYTKEQLDIFDFIEKNDKLLIHASAGCAKTYTAKEIIKKGNYSNFLYTAFNKAIVEEGRKALSPLGGDCKTYHALAYSYIKPSRIRELDFNVLGNNFSYKDKDLILSGINKFFLSSSLDIQEYFNNYFKNSTLKEEANRIVDRMLDDSLPPSFNFLLKYFHLMLNEGLECSYDLVIFDEINDASAVTLEIFKLIKAKKKIGLGESHQAIYQFLDLKDGFKELTDFPVLNLTQSFRCSIPIAKSVESFMRKTLSRNFTFKGTASPVANGKHLHVTSTNAAIIREVSHRLSLGKSFTLLRKPYDIFSYPMDIVSASQGNKVFSIKHRFLEKEYKKFIETKYSKSFYSYLVEVVNNEETKSAVTLLLYFIKTNQNIFKLYNKVKNIKADKDYVIATGYTAKGLEFESVYIDESLNSLLKKHFNGGNRNNEDYITAMRLYYVSCSRAGKHLHNAIYL